MATKKKLLQAAAGSAGGAVLDITDVFSTYLYTGTSGTQTITNGIDLSGEGGLVWVKSRGFTRNHVLVDTERGVRRNLQSNTTAVEGSVSGDNVNAFYSNGFDAGPSGEVNASSEDYASWTFRKAPKFFDVVTYTGTSAVQNISHSLGSVPGMIIVKCTNTAKNWGVYHRSVGSTKYLQLNTTAEANINSGFWNNTDPTSTQFTLGTQSNVNGNGNTYVAYLFAHNDSGDGEFGPDGDQDIIKCGSYTTDGSGNASVTLGWEPQWLLFKTSSTAQNWLIADTMRGMPFGGSMQTLLPSTAGAEAANFVSKLNATGFEITGSASTTYIYMAIRRGPLAPPEAGTEVFNIDVRDDTDAPMYKSGFVTDFSLYRDKAGGDDWRVTSRLQGTAGTFPEISTAAESSAYTTSSWDWMNGFHDAGSVNTGYLSWMWKRAPSFCDVVCWYQPTDNAVTTINHNLGVAPEMIWTKSRTGTRGWPVFHKDRTPMLRLDTTTRGTDTDPHQNIGSTSFQVNGSVTGEVGGPENYMSYLFSSLAGVSKVGGYTGNGTSQTIDCGFAAGARYVLIKRTDVNGDWYVWDTARGVVTGNSPHLSLNKTAAEVSDDSIDPDGSGFIVNQISATNINVSSATYIYYAVA